MSALQSLKNRSKRYVICSDMVEARGVEPLSENLSARLSTSVVDDLTFPYLRPHQQGRRLSSLLNPARAETLSGWFPTLMMPVSAVVGNYGRTVALIKQRRVRN